MERVVGTPRRSGPTREPVDRFVKSTRAALRRIRICSGGWPHHASVSARAIGGRSDDYESDARAESGLVARPQHDDSGTAWTTSNSLRPSGVSVCSVAMRAALSLAGR